MEIQKLMAATELIRKKIGTITLLQTGMLLAVMENDGIMMSDLVEMFKTTRAAVSRNVGKLTKPGSVGPKTVHTPIVKAGLLYSREWDSDTRAKAVFLTKEGKALRAMLRRLQ